MSSGGSSVSGREHEWEVFTPKPNIFIGRWRPVLSFGGGNWQSSHEMGSAAEAEQWAREAITTYFCDVETLAQAIWKATTDRVVETSRGAASSWADVVESEKLKWSGIASQAIHLRKLESGLL